MPAGNRGIPAGPPSSATDAGEHIPHRHFVQLYGLRCPHGRRDVWQAWARDTAERPGLGRSPCVCTEGSPFCCDTEASSRLGDAGAGPRRGGGTRRRMVSRSGGGVGRARRAGAGRAGDHRSDPRQAVATGIAITTPGSRRGRRTPSRVRSNPIPTPTSHPDSPLLGNRDYPPDLHKSPHFPRFPPTALARVCGWTRARSCKRQRERVAMPSTRKLGLFASTSGPGWAACRASSALALAVAFAA